MRRGSGERAGGDLLSGAVFGGTANFFLRLRGIPMNLERSTVTCVPSFADPSETLRACFLLVLKLGPFGGADFGCAFERPPGKTNGAGVGAGAEVPGSDSVVEGLRELPDETDCEPIDRASVVCIGAL